MLCRSSPPSIGPTGQNYLKPHVPGTGRYDGQERLSCVFCGCWLGEAYVPGDSRTIELEKS